MSLNVRFSREITIAVRKSLPIEKGGLTLYPITMADYDDYVICKDALTILQASLPAKYLGFDYMSALFAMAMDEAQGTLDFSNGSAASSPGLKLAFQRVLRLLQLSLRVSEKEIADIASDIVYTKNEFDELSIDHIVIHQNGKDVNLTPSVFSQVIRPLIAFQNAIELPDETANPDLINESKKYKKDADGVKLKPDVDDLIASVAYLSHVSAAEILTWTVREFEYRARAIERDKRYMLCAQAETSGLASFEKGNPAPSWFYDADIDSLGTTSLSELGKKLGGAGVKQQS